MRLDKGAHSGDCIILGGGLAGLSAAAHLGGRATVFEAGARPGGECITDWVNGYGFDKSGHLLHVRTPEMRRFIARLLPGKLCRIRRDARIHLQGKEFDYPFQANIRGLAEHEKMQALCDYLTATGHKQKPPANFLEWCRNQFGRTISSLFLEPYNRKLWTVPPETLTLDWMGAYMPQPDIARVVTGAFSPHASAQGYNAEFYYPKRGGISQLAEALAGKARRLHLNARAVRLDPRKRTVDIAGHGRISWKRLISSVPLPALVAMLDSPPDGILEALRQLQWSSVVVVNLAVAREQIHPAHWLYFPEEKYAFYRVGFPSNFSRIAPAGHSTLYAEVALPAGTGWESRAVIAKKVRQGLVEAGIVRERDDVRTEHLQYIPYAYVIFDRSYAQARKRLLQYLDRYGIMCVGRWGHWEYSAMEDAMLAGAAAARQIQSRGGMQ